MVNVLWASEFVNPPKGACLSSIILSLLDGNVKMSPHEPGDIHVDSEGIETSDRYFTMRAREPGVCQSRRAARAIASAGQTPQKALPARQRSLPSIKRETPSVGPIPISEFARI